MSKKLKVLVFSKYDQKGASSRLRTIQYLKGIEQASISITLSPLFDAKYLEDLYNGNLRKITILKYYFKRIRMLFGLGKYDLVWIEKEIFPWFPLPVEKLLAKWGVRYIVDYDDAIFHTYDTHRSGLVRQLLSNKIPTVMKHAALVTVCNSYLEKKAKKAGAKRIEVLPTVVDIQRYIPVYHAKNHKLVIGWIGTPKTEKYLIAMKEILDKLASMIEIKVMVVGGQEFFSEKFEYEILPWDEKKESEYLQQIDIGIMPLTDSPWEKGKCGYKLIQYMACGKPVIASNVGMNCEIIQTGVNGYLANDEQAWIDAFKALMKLEKRVELGKNARALVERTYSLQNTLDHRIRFLKESISK